MNEREKRGSRTVRIPERMEGKTLRKSKRRKCNQENLQER